MGKPGIWTDSKKVPRNLFLIINHRRTRESELHPRETNGCLHNPSWMACWLWLPDWLSVLAGWRETVCQYWLWDIPIYILFTLCAQSLSECRPINIPSGDSLQPAGYGFGVLLPLKCPEKVTSSSSSCRRHSIWFSESYLIVVCQWPTQVNTRLNLFGDQTTKLFLSTQTSLGCRGVE